MQVTRIWGIIRIKEKIASDVVVTLADTGLDEALEAICLKLDVPHPVVLRKHRSEFLKFSRTRFRPDDFMEAVGFAGLEVEILHDRKKKESLYSDSEM
jgi:hypothetical protein